MSPRCVLETSIVAFSPHMTVTPCPIATTTLLFRERIQRCKHLSIYYGEYGH